MLKRQELSELRSHIGYVFQNGALFDSMNVFENVRLGITDEDKLRRPGVLPPARRRVHPAGESAARYDREVSRPAVGRDAEAGGHRPRHRGKPQVSALRRAHLRPRSGQRRHHRRPGAAARPRARRHQRHGDARRARRLSGGRPAGPADRGEDRACRAPRRSSSPRRTRRCRSSWSATSTTPPSRPEPPWICATSGKSPSARS